MPSPANELEERALGVFVELRTYFAQIVLADLGGAWHAVLRLLDDGPDRALEESWAGARLVVGTSEKAALVTLADGRTPARTLGHRRLVRAAVRRPGRLGGAGGR